MERVVVVVEEADMTIDLDGSGLGGINANNEARR